MIHSCNNISFIEFHLYIQENALKHGERGSLMQELDENGARAFASDQSRVSQMDGSRMVRFREMTETRGCSAQICDFLYGCDA